MRNGNRQRRGASCACCAARSPSAPSARFWQAAQCASTDRRRGHERLALPTSPARAVHRRRAAHVARNRSITAFARRCRRERKFRDETLVQSGGGSIGVAPPAASRRARLSAAQARCRKIPRRRSGRGPPTSAGSRGACTPTTLRAAAGNRVASPAAGGSASTRALTRRSRFFAIVVRIVRVGRSLDAPYTGTISPT